MRVFILDGTPDEVAALAAKLPELKVLLVGSGNLVEPREPTLMPSRWSRDNAERLLGELTGPRREFVRVLLSQPEGKASSELLQKRLHQYIKPSVSRKAAAITAFRTAITRRARRLTERSDRRPNQELGFRRRTRLSAYRASLWAMESNEGHALIVCLVRRGSIGLSQMTKRDIHRRAK